MMTTPPWILGLANNMHNGAACIVRGARIVVAVQEERLSRVKRARLNLTDSFACVDYCLEAAGIGPEDLALVVECRSENAEGAPYAGSRLEERLGGVPHVLVSHHLAHAYSCAGPSGFDEATVLVVDGGGSPVEVLPAAEQRALPTEPRARAYEHLSIYEYRGGALEPVRKLASAMPYLSGLTSLRGKGMPEFASLGHMFSAVAFLTFHDYSDAGKVMGLAPYGRATLDVEEWFRWSGDDLVFENGIPARFAGCPPWPAAQQEHADLAASVQRALERALDGVLARIRRWGLPRDLAYAGGVALNGVANHRVLAPGTDRLFVLPAAEDSGTAIGAAYYGLGLLEPAARPAAFATDSLGRVRRPAELEAALAALPAVEEWRGEDTLGESAELLARGEVLGWLEGGSELGPRALGNRSILYDPRATDAKELLNARVKHRESFRPFAPVVLAEHAGEWLEFSERTQPLEYMLGVCPFRSGVDLPAVVHEDGTGRPQLLTSEANPSLHRLLTRFFELTGVPMLVNTSFNVMGEPIVETARDALWAMLSTGIDWTYVNGRLFSKRSDYPGVGGLVPRAACDVVDADTWPGLKCRTESGEFVHRIPDVAVLELLERMDGTRTVDAIARDRLATEEVGEHETLRTFIWLVRIGAVALVDYRAASQG